MYYVNKIVTWVMSPMGILFLGLGAAWAARAVSSRFKVQGLRFKVHRWIVGVTLVFVWLMGCGITIRLIGVPLEVDEIDLMTLPKADAIVLLGGGMGVHGKCGRPEMFAGADRVWAAAQLYKAGKAPVVFVTGTNNIASTSGLLADFGVPANVLRSVNGARNTEEEARGICEKLKSCKVEKLKVLLVTSAWHMPRAKTLFARAGLEVTPAPTDHEMHYAAEAPLTFGDFFPGAEALARNGWALKEWVARFCYWLKG